MKTGETSIDDFPMLKGVSQLRKVLEPTICQYDRGNGFTLVLLWCLDCRFLHQKEEGKNAKAVY